jgi:uncharacterized membrane protein YqiK
MTIPEQPDQPGDIDRWLDGLVGRGKADAQTRMLHEALLRRSERQRAVDNTDDAGLERLLFRLRSERLLEASGGKVRWRPTPMWMGIAASFAVVAIILPTLLGTLNEYPQDDTERVRSTGAPQRVAVEAPQKAAEAARAKLREIGIAATIEAKAAGVELRAEVPAAQREKTAAALAEWNIKLPAKGPLRVLLVLERKTSP